MNVTSLLHTLFFQICFWLQHLHSTFNLSDSKYVDIFFSSYAMDIVKILISQGINDSSRSVSIGSHWAYLKLNINSNKRFKHNITWTYNVENVGGSLFPLFSNSSKLNKVSIFTRHSSLWLEWGPRFVGVSLKENELWENFVENSYLYRMRDHHLLWQNPKVIW